MRKECNNKDISKYASYFHDGEIFEIEHADDNIQILMQSAEIDPADAKGFSLSKDHRLVGKLHVERVKSVRENDISFVGKMGLKLNENDILHLKVSANVVHLEVAWRGGPTKNDFSAYEILAEKIWWDNLPDYFESAPGK